MYKESYIEAQLRDGMKKIGGRAYKWESPGAVGVPDRIVIFPDGSVQFVELKTRMGKIRPVQRARIKELRALGQTVHVVKGISGLVSFFTANGYPEIAEPLKKRIKRDEE